MTSTKQTMEASHLQTHSNPKPNSESESELRPWALEHVDTHARGIAIAVPFLTFTMHSVLAHCALFVPSETVQWPIWPWYNIVAAVASLCGLIGAAKLKPTLVTLYLMAHFTTLLVCTLTLINVILPFDLAAMGEFVPNVDFDVRPICRDIDVSYGQDVGWMDRCAATFMIVKNGTAWVGLVLMGAQWWALFYAWEWNKELKYAQEMKQAKNTQDTNRVDSEFLGENRGHSIV